jgi:ABC-2 type transport system ATP-binding protein
MSSAKAQNIHLAKSGTLTYNVLTMKNAIEIRSLSKTYQNGVHALKDVNLDIREGEIFALLGENGAGKTTMIGIICGIVNKTGGTVTVMGKDNVKDYRFTRKQIGLVPQEIKLDIFMKVIDAVRFSRGYFGLGKDEKKVEEVLKALELWEHKDKTAMHLSGGMQRRLLIAKALVHEPKILFLDEPTAGVDVNLRQGMWDYVRKLQKEGVTIILTTHYIEEAEEMADRIGIIAQGELKIVEEKNKLMETLGQKKMVMKLSQALGEVPTSLSNLDITLSEDKTSLEYTYKAGSGKIHDVLSALANSNVQIQEIDTEETKLEEIFLNIARKK